MSNVTAITRSADEAQKQKIIEALGTENKPDQWLVFMDTVLSILGDVLKAGRPKPSVIQNSLIGRLGFTSWRSMVETSIDDGGLGWNWSAWVAWRRAYKIVQDNDYLREMKASSAQVNKWDQELKSDEMPFPKTLEDFEHWRASRKDDREQKSQETIASLKRQIKLLEGELIQIKNSSRLTFLKAFFMGWK